MRTFKPSKPESSTVDYWTWTRSRGLRVTYKNGLAVKSEWTLKELVSATHLHGDGLPAVEITKQGD